MAVMDMELLGGGGGRCALGELMAGGSASHDFSKA
jgi:hypothetical protein